jgi:hypothetical protein
LEKYPSRVVWSRIGNPCIFELDKVATKNAVKKMAAFLF